MVCVYDIYYENFLLLSLQVKFPWPGQQTIWCITIYELNQMRADLVLIFRL